VSRRGGPGAEGVLGLDVGTESARAGLFGLDGRLLAEGRAGYPTWFPEPGQAEQDPAAVWDAVCTAVRGCLSAAPGVRPLGFSLCATAVTAITVNGDGEPFGPALLWMDTRAAAEAAEITATGHPSLWFTGGHVSPEWMLPKALWLRRHQPDRYARARWLVELHDWILYRVTGRWALAAATASAEWGYDPHTGTWPADLLAGVGLADLPQRWPETVLAPGEPAGAVSPAGAAATGLPPGLPVFQGLMDSFAAALACDVFQPGRAAVSLGSSSSYMALTPEPVSDPRLLGPIRDALGPGTTLMQGGQTCAASLVRWFCTELGGGRDPAVLDAAAAGVPPGSDGIIALDTWQGSRTPFRDPHRRGAFTGLALGHGRAHLYRALLESVAYGGRQVTEAFDEAGTGLAELVLTGGGSGSQLWRQIHADVIGRPLLRLDQPQPAALGAAICAAAGLGACPDLRSAAAAMSRVVPGAQPDPGNRRAYETAFSTYQAAARALGPPGWGAPPPGSGPPG
jgi:sugar (pentulose or hexulose) kinase